MEIAAAAAAIAGVQPVQDTYQTGNISMYSTPRNISISGGTHTLVNGPSYTLHNVTTDRRWIIDLQNHTAPGAFHNSGERYDAPKCHPDTRVAVIKDIMDWVRDPNRVEQFLWIYGPAGSGKSSIAQTIAELCEAEGILASDYFFSRTAPGRNRETNLIATLACQLITTIPRICTYMEAAINHDPLIFSRSLSLQLDSLILDPLNQLVASSHGSPSQEKPYPFLVIIDGLDECGKPESQRYILSSIYSALQKSAAQLIFIIASRPEQVIRDTFNGDLNLYTRSLVLNHKYLPDNDIRLFLESNFLEIRQKHPLAKYLPSDWPSSSDMDYLVSKASGQFVYASTVAKFVKSPRDRPMDRLKIIRNASPPGNNVPFAELDELYKLILGSIEPSRLEKVLDIFGWVLAEADIENSWGWRLFGIPNIEYFLGYQPGDITLLLSDLHSIIKIEPASGLSLFHASLGDFFRDRSRSGSFFIDMGIYSDIELHREYTSRYDNYLRGSLSLWVDAYRKNTAQFAVLTALTLKVKHDSRSTVYFFQRKIPESRGYMVPTFPLTLRADFFARAGYYDLSGTDDCISRLVRIVAEPDKSGHRWIDTSEPYVKLAMVILEIFQTRPSDVESGTEVPIDQDGFETIGLELLSATFNRIPNELSLIEYLTDGRDRDFVYLEELGKNKLQVLIENYIQEYQRSQIVPQAMNTKVVTEAMDTKAVPEAVNTKVVPEAMNTKVVPKRRRWFWH
ncbi:hypothetical protein CVT25_009805 [Psilocybe cyanescens]|uniref:Nephrocystin 3-like N-terminal domain-containing protein n=1 Tax=Psilocybe cyanescens TaxID=93625 RepID=A0A409X7Z2_PSICY|nr:hypothetical protein CVT25_009805 [Psilocybe cyanescens]